MLVLLVGGVVLLFAMGKDTVGAAAWLAPVFLLRFTRTAPRWYGLLAWPVMSLAFLFQFRGMVPLPWSGELLTAVVSGLFGFAPYALDRWLRRRPSSFSSTLIFPCALAGLDCFNGSFGPYGSGGALGYSQYGNLPIMQLAAITGVYGISFLVAWPGAVVNWAWEREFSGRVVRRGALILAGVIAAVYVGGSLRLSWSGTPAGYRRVAGIAADNYAMFPSQSCQNRFWSGQPLSHDELAAVKMAMARANATLLAKSEREAKAGASLVFWSETGARILKSEEAGLMAQGGELARRNKIYLGMAMMTGEPGRPKPAQNKLVLIGPDGGVLYEYWKSRPVPGSEQAATQTNGNRMYFADTSLGRMGSFICFDLDFPALVRQAGRARADLIISPANDWGDRSPAHPDDRVSGRRKWLQPDPQRQQRTLGRRRLSGPHPCRNRLLHECRSCDCRLPADPLRAHPLLEHRGSLCVDLSRWPHRAGLHRPAAGGPWLRSQRRCEGVVQSARALNSGCARNYYPHPELSSRARL
jgi:apolipoprotein N-acyltransferase